MWQKQINQHFPEPLNGSKPGSVLGRGLCRWCLLRGVCSPEAWEDQTSGRMLRGTVAKALLQATACPSPTHLVAAEGFLSQDCSSWTHTALGRHSPLGCLAAPQLRAETEAASSLGHPCCTATTAHPGHPWSQPGAHISPAPATVWPWACCRLQGP